MKEHEKFIKSEISKINLDKWFKGLEINSDPGEEYIKEWVKDNAPFFRKKYNSKKMKELMVDLNHLLDTIDKMSKKRTVAALKSMQKRLEFLTNYTENGNGKNGNGKMEVKHEL